MVKRPPVTVLSIEFCEPKALLDKDGSPLSVDKIEPFLTTTEMEVVKGHDGEPIVVLIDYARFDGALKQGYLCRPATSQEIG